MFGLTETEVGSLLVVAVVVGVLGWAMTDAAGTTRLLSAVLGAIAALVAGSIVLVSFDRYRGS